MTQALQPTTKEAEAIKALKTLAKKWPKSLWLFSASGTLLVMRTDKDGERVRLGHNGVDPGYVLDEIKIPNDGGDW